MKKLIVYYGDTPMCIEGFPKDCKRSKEGALHVLPRKNMTVTDEEYEHILKSRPEMKQNLKIIAELDEPKKKDESKEEGAKESQDQAPEAEAQSEESQEAEEAHDEEMEESDSEDEEEL